MEISTHHENEVIRAVQHQVPFTPRPYAEIGRLVDLPESQVIELLQKWLDHGKLREISAILEGSALGYESALVAGRVPEGDLERVVPILNAHPTITHNYLRDHDYNLWFTIAAPQEIGLDAMVAALERLTRVDLQMLRRRETFKIGVNFDLRTRQNHTEAAPLATGKPIELSEQTRALFRVLQTPAPIAERPFAELARRCGTDEERLLAFGQRHLGGAMRRYVGTLRHKRLGVSANAMIVWNVPEQHLSEAGQRLAQAPEVSHCYSRNSIEGFPYTLYSMVHGPDLDACREVAARLSGALRAADYQLLVSLEEFKKARLRYFLPELDDWWRAHGE
jgi:DNA-binding Lrp family transcriptional regulator